MRWVRRSLARQIAFLVVVAVVCAVGLSTTASIVREVGAFNERRSAELSGAGAIIASSVAEPVVSGEHQRISRALTAIRDLPWIASAEVYDPDGRLLAQMGSSALLLDKRLTQPLRAAGPPEVNDTMTARIPVIYGGQDVGTLVLRSEPSALRERIWEMVWDAVLTAVVCIMVGGLVAIRFERALLRPLHRLAAVMDHVRKFGNFDQTVERTTDDETGQLVDAFNDMLGQIRARDRSLAAQRDTLEQTVERRTRELREARDSAQDANKAKSDFLATMSHEIRTPMNGMMVMAELLASSELDPRQLRYAEVIKKSGQSLLAIINDILDLAKIESGKLELESIAFDPSECIDDVLSLFWERASEKGLDLSAHVAADVPAKILGDPVRFNQVLSNLVNNAVKFTHSGYVAVSLSRQGPDRLFLAVADTGVGISQDQHDKVFAAFSQADQSTTRKFGGTGLGLAICGRLVRAMGGEITLISQTGDGATFGFGFDAPSAEPAPDLAGDLSDLSFLIVTDKPAAGQALRQYLRDANARDVRLVSDQGDAAERAPYADCVIAEPDDLNYLCDLDVFENTPKAIRLALLSLGEPLPEQLLRSRRAHDILQQPLARGALHELIERIAQGRLKGAAALVTQAGATQHRSFAGRRILVADDNEINREVIGEALGRMGVDVDFAVNGQEAVDAVAQGGYQLVFMDCSMPVMDGFEATRRIRQREAKGAVARLPVIALTAQVASADKDAWKHAGMDDIILKPFTIAAIENCLTHFFGPGEAPDSGGVQAAETDLGSATDADDPAEGAEASAPANLQAAAFPVREKDDLIDEEVFAQLRAMQSSKGGDMASRVITLFLERAPDLMNDLTSAMRGRRPSEVEQAAHALKSMACNLGARKLADACADLERGAVDQSLTTLGHAFDRVIAAQRATAQELSRRLSQQSAAQHRDAA